MFNRPSIHGIPDSPHAAETILASNYTQLHPKAEHMHANDPIKNLLLRLL